MKSFVGQNPSGAKWFCHLILPEEKALRGAAGDEAIPTALPDSCSRGWCVSVAGVRPRAPASSHKHPIGARGRTPITHLRTAQQSPWLVYVPVHQLLRISTPLAHEDVRQSLIYGRHSSLRGWCTSSCTSFSFGSRYLPAVDVLCPPKILFNLNFPNFTIHPCPSAGKFPIKSVLY